MTINIPLVLNAVLDEYELSVNGCHGVAHWKSEFFRRAGVRCCGVGYCVGPLIPRILT